MKRKPFSHMRQEGRDRIEALLDAGHLQKEIAKILKVDKSTVSRELARHKTAKGRYDAKRAQEKALVSRSNSKYQGMKIEACPPLKQDIIAELKRHRSPDEIAGRMKREKRIPRVGTNAIYKWLRSSLGERYCRYLCTKRKRKKKQKKLPKREMIPNRISIHDKPQHAGLVELEGDTFLSPKRLRTTESGFLGSVRGVHLLVGTKLPNLKPTTMTLGVERSTKPLAADLLILDNGIENKRHEDFPLDTYFCDPHSPWQKPHVEGDIGLLRRWFIPKGTDLRGVSERQLQTYLHILNHKHRKSLGYASAYEIGLKRGIIETIPEKSLAVEVAFH
jgi:IS30 family transposase